MPYRPIWILLAAACSAGAAAMPTLIDQGYRQMYNMQFADAHETFREWQRQHPDDAMGPVSEAAAYLFAEFDRLHILQSGFFTQDQHFLTDHKPSPDPVWNPTAISNSMKMRTNDGRQPYCAALVRLSRRPFS